MAEYCRPAELKDALDLLANGGWRILAGGTDLYPAHAAYDHLPGAVLDITGLDELDGIVKWKGMWRIGATTRWSSLIGADLPPAFDGLKQAAAQIGAVQVQNMATIGGNLCNASPAADGVPVLLGLDARIEMASARGYREMPLADFIAGVRRTRLESDEIVTAILIPDPGPAARSHFLKLGARSYLVISIAMVHVLLFPDSSGRVADARIAVGACSPVACRLNALERDLIGHPFDTSLADRVMEEHFAPLSPIDDVRATAAYRLEAAREMTRRAITAIVPGGGVV